MAGLLAVACELPKDLETLKKHHSALNLHMVPDKDAPGEKLFQELKRHSKVNFDVEYLIMNPGYNQKNLDRLIENAKILNLPIEIFEEINL